MPFATSDDLLTGSIQKTSGAVDQAITAADDEINSVLGQVYLLPLSPTPAADTADYLLLKRITVLIATGRYILARASGAEDDNQHAYGLSVLKEGQNLLAQVASGMLDLRTITKIAGSASSVAGPSIVQGDSVSGTDAFYEWLSGSPSTGGLIQTWQPGITS